MLKVPRSAYEPRATSLPCRTSASVVALVLHSFLRYPLFTWFIHLSGFMYVPGMVFRTEAEEQVAIYEQEESFDLGAEAEAEFDVCWCEGGNACRSGSDFTAVVVSVLVAGPQRNLQVVCPYDTRCPFEFRDTPESHLLGLSPVLVLLRDNCTSTFSRFLTGKGGFPA